MHPRSTGKTRANRVGKIARLPHAIREELNHKLLDNRPGKEILSWLNGLPETAAVIAVMNEPGNSPGGHAAGPIDAVNLSDWRYGGYAEWTRRREQLQTTKYLAEHAVKLASASGGDLSEGAAAMLSGHLLEVFEELQGAREAGAGEGGPEAEELARAVERAARSLASVRAGDHQAKKLKLEERAREQKDRELDLAEARVQRDQARAVQKYRDDERVKAICDGRGSNSEKIEALGTLMFGEHFKALKDNAKAD